MSDQLSLELEASLPSPPTTLRPMLARPLPEPFDSSDHLFEPSWGGERALARVSSEGVGFVLGDGREVTDVLPELADLSERILARSAVLDGELVVVDQAGRADAPGLRERLAGSGGRSVAYLVFDVLDLDGRPLLGAPLVRRREELGRVLTPGESVVAVPAIATEGRALHAAVTEQGLAGMLARVRTSPYLPGVRSRLWRFVPAGRPRAGAAVAEPDMSAAASPVIALIRRLPLED